MKRHSLLLSIILPVSIGARPIADTHATLSFFSPGDLVFDIGAYVGAYTDHYVAHGARVVAVEPQHACIEILQKRYANNPDVTVVGAAISDCAGTLEFYISLYSRPLATCSTLWMEESRYKTRFNASWNNVLRVPATTLDVLIAQHGMPQLCMIDVEGFEYNVLLGLSQPIPYIAFEFHQEMMVSTQACLERLVELGYHDFNFSVANEGACILTEWVDAEKLMLAIDITANQRAMRDSMCGEIYARHCN